MARRELRDEDFELGSGLLDDFDGVVEDAWFAPPRQEYIDRTGGEPTPFLHLSIVSPDADQPIEQVYSIGTARQWQVERDGKEVVSGKKPDYHNFVANSRGGELVGRIIELAGGGDKAKGVQAVKERGFLMTEAEFFVGLNAHWERESRLTVGGDTRDILLPTAIHGFGEAEAVATPGAAGLPFSDEEIEKLVGLASGRTEQQLKQQVMRDAGLKKNKELLNSVFNKNLLKELEAAEKLTRGPDGKYI